MLAKESKVCVAVMDLGKACGRTKWEANSNVGIVEGRKLLKEAITF